MSDTDALSALKADYDAGRVSVLVGSGFTKNAYAGASDWSELLRDMAYELYPDELNLKTDLRAFLSKKGYMKVVDDFIAKRGCREALEVYIESHVPYVDTNGDIVSLSTNDSIKLNKADFKVHNALLACKNWQNIFTTNYDNFLEKAHELYKEPTTNIKVIKSGYELSCKNAGDIVKIHGSLVRKQDTLNEDFLFDGDKSRRYIISSEDYRDYKVKHEALCSYMRIALLAGKFCLIGFSGDDPNYKGWVDWVKDVLDMAPQGEKKDDELKDETKVYLIDVSNNEPSIEQKLYNRNHHISVIRLLNKDVYNELRHCLAEEEDADEGKSMIQSNEANAKPIRDILCAFFKYLSSGAEPKEMEAEEASGKSEERKKSLSDICNRIIYLQNKNKNIDEEGKVLVQLRKETRFVANVNRMKTIAFHIERKARTRNKVELSEIERQLFLIALNDCGEAKKCLYGALSRAKLLPLKGQKGYDLYLKLRRREKTYEGAHEQYKARKDSDTYESVLRCMYGLDFSCAREILSVWQPRGRYIAKKASMNFLFESRKGIDELEAYIDKVEGQDRYIAINIHHFISLSFPSKYDTSDLRSNNVEGFYEIAQQILDNVTRHAEDFDAYGSETTRRFIAGSDDDLTRKHSKRLLNLFADTAILPVYGILNIIGVNQWYAVFSCLVNEYPYPCLFYSSLFDDRKAQKRMGQDYIYRDELYDKVPDLLKCSLAALNDDSTPDRVKIGLQRISAEFYEAVREQDWIEDYVCFLRNSERNTVSHPSYRQTFRINVQQGMVALQKPENISSVLTECLKLMKAFANNADRLDEIIPYSLHFEKVNKLNQEQLGLLEEILGSADFNNLLPLLTRMKYHQLFPDDKIPHKLMGKIEEGLDNHTILTNNLYNAARFSMGNKTLMEKIRKRIVDINLWTPPSSKGRVYPMQVFPIMGLSDCDWTDDELAALKQQIMQGYKEIISQLDKNLGGLMNYDEVLRNMTLFLRNSTISDADKKLLNEVEQSLAELRGWSDLKDALLSNKAGIMSDALHDLNDMLNDETFERYKEYFDIVLENALRKSKPKLSDSLLLVARVLHKQKTYVTQISSYVDKLVRIVKAYHPSSLIDDNLVVRKAMPALISIAEDLKDVAGINQQDLCEWISDDLKTRYNNDYRDWVN